MPRTFNLPETSYPVGVITQTIDSFQPNTSVATMTLTRVNWPGVPADDVCEVSIDWSDGTGAKWRLPGGVVLDKQGVPFAFHTLSVGIPFVSDGQGGRAKKNVISALVTFRVFQPLTTAISVSAD